MAAAAGGGNLLFSPEEKPSLPPIKLEKPYAMYERHFSLFWTCCLLPHNASSPGSPYCIFVKDS